MVSCGLIALGRHVDAILLATDLGTSMRLSKRSVEQAAKTGSRYFLWDEELIGFGMRVEASGRKTFICRYRSGGVRRQYTVGRFGTITVDQARGEARRILGSVSLGKDPSASKRAQRSALLFRDLVNSFLEGHGPKLKPGSRKDYESALIGHAVPVIGNLAVTAIAPADFDRLHLKLADRPYRANRVLAYVGSVFSWAQRNGLVEKGFNPAADVQRFKEPSRERYLTPDEIKRLGEVLRRAETSGLPWEIKAIGASVKHVAKSNRTEVYPLHVTGAVRLLLLTGCRLREILDLRWRDVDLDRGFLWLPDSKTGKRPVLLSAAATEVITTIPRLGTYVVPGANPDMPRHDLKKPWSHIRRLADLDDVRLHDLRHTHASIGAGVGLGLPIVGGLLGHKSTQTTQRYAHLADDPLRRAAERIGDELNRALSHGE
jgi:integrase